jgi:hypothetical protein
MLVAGFVCNYLIKPLAGKWFMKPEEVSALQAKQGAAAADAADCLAVLRFGPSCRRRPRSSARPAPAPSPPTAPAAAPAFAPIRDLEFAQKAKRKSATAVDAAPAEGRY